MKTYFFALGTHPKLSMAEIKSVLNNQKISFEAVFNTDKIFVIKAKEIKPEFIDQLGGTIKFGEILLMTPKVEADQLFELINYNEDEKFYFGISTYHTGQIKLLPLGLEIKKRLKQNNIACRFVTGKENPLSSVIVAKNKLTQTNGFEFVIIENDNKFLIGKTQSIQNFEKYSKIDYGRPARNDLQGMLPPKIAQIMINLAEQKLLAKILDPFCGSGTILQMSALLGFKNLFGTDANHLAIEDTRENLTWLANEYKLNFNFQLQQIEAGKLPEKFENKSIDAIIFEPYMGPPLKGNETGAKMKKLQDELNLLYKQTLSACNKILKDNGRIVMILPLFEINEKKYYLDLTVINHHFTIKEKYKYSRPGQKVIRNILVLEKLK